MFIVVIWQLYFCQISMKCTLNLRKIMRYQFPEIYSLSVYLSQQISKQNFILIFLTCLYDLNQLKLLPSFSYNGLETVVTRINIYFSIKDLQ